MDRFPRFLLFIPAVLCTVAAYAQHAADPAARYFRVIALVHLVGSGKKGDPVRPEYVPDAPSRSGIVSWAMQKSDDGKYALVQLVAVDHKALVPILADKRPDVQVFEIGKANPADIQKALRGAKKDFDLASFQVVAQ